MTHKAELVYLTNKFSCQSVTALSRPLGSTYTVELFEKHAFELGHIVHVSIGSLVLFGLIETVSHSFSYTTLVIICPIKTLKYQCTHQYFDTISVSKLIEKLFFPQKFGLNLRFSHKLDQSFIYGYTPHPKDTHLDIYTYLYKQFGVVGELQPSHMGIYFCHYEDLTHQEGITLPPSPLSKSDYHTGFQEHIYQETFLEKNITKQQRFIHNQLNVKLFSNIILPNKLGPSPNSLVIEQNLFFNCSSRKSPFLRIESLVGALKPSSIPCSPSRMYQRAIVYNDNLVDVFYHELSTPKTTQSTNIPYGAVSSKNCTKAHVIKDISQKSYHDHHVAYQKGEHVIIGFGQFPTFKPYLLGAIGNQARKNLITHKNSHEQGVKTSNGTNIVVKDKAQSNELLLEKSDQKAKVQLFQNNLGDSSIDFVHMKNSIEFHSLSDLTTKSENIVFSSETAIYEAPQVQITSITFRVFSASHKMEATKGLIQSKDFNVDATRSMINAQKEITWGTKEAFNLKSDKAHVEANQLTLYSANSIILTSGSNSVTLTKNCIEFKGRALSVQGSIFLFGQITK